MEKFNWKLTIKVNICMLRVTGLWPSGDDTYKRNLYSAYSVISFALFIIGHVSFQTINLYFIRSDLQAITATIFILLTDVGAGLKTFCLIKNMGTIKQLMVTLNSDVFQPRNSEQRLLVRPTLEVWKKIYFTYCGSALGALFFLTLFPVLDKSVKDFRLPFLAWYPYNTKISPNYELTYFYQTVSIWYIAMTNGNVDTMLAALNMYIGTQFDILCDNLRNLTSAKDVNKQLIECVKHHKAILRFAASSNRCFDWIIFLQFFGSAISIGLTMFQMTVVPPFSNEFYARLFFANAVLVEIFIYCWFGNEVEVKSNKVTYAVFESDWVNMSQETKKQLIFFALKCEKPLKVSALNLFYLSLETFVRILRTAWSYFALLHQVNSQNDEN